jgi:GWxTD domain-containing protein
VSPIERHRGFLIALAILMCCTPFVHSQDVPEGEARRQAIRDSIRKFDHSDSPYKAWLRQDVVWIISDEERVAFKRLENDAERDQFIDAFWARRDPTPGTFENEFKDEHYRRIVYANDHFGSLIPGWKSDRGRMYIMFGPPDEIESYPTGRVEERTPEGDALSSYPLEVWHYKHMEGIGKDIVLEFVDACRCGAYGMPVTGTTAEVLRAAGPKLVIPQFGILEPGDPNSRSFFAAGARPKLMFKNLEEKLNARLNWKGLPFDVGTGTVRATDFTSVVPITITFQRSDNVFAGKDSTRPASVNIFGRVTALSGRVVEVFEDTRELDGTIESGLSSKDTTIVETLALRNGHYKIEIAAQEAGSDRWGTWVGEVRPGDE